MVSDERSRRVVFVSHCLLNQNVRYAGGALGAGAIESVVARFAGRGVGIVQMPCPEQAAWGGVGKRLMVRAYGSRARWVYRLRRVLLPLFVAYTRLRYRRIARRIARQIDDYVRSGYEVLGIVGVDDSPSCGVRRTVDLRRALPVVASFDMSAIDRETFNARAIRDCFVEGQGFFVAALRLELDRRKLPPPLLEYHVDDDSLD